MNSDNYTIHWTVTNAVANQVHDDINVSDNTSTIVLLYPSTSVDVMCTVNRTISGGYVIENTTSTHLTIVRECQITVLYIYIQDYTYRNHHFVYIQLQNILGACY